MKYLRMDGSSQQALLANLRTMPEYLAAQFGGLTADEVLRPGPANTFSPVEQCWHLADLEREGFGERMRRLRAEEKSLLRNGIAMACRRAWDRSRSATSPS